MFNKTACASVCVCECVSVFTLVYFGIYECFMADMSGQGL